MNGEITRAFALPRSVLSYRGIAAKSSFIAFPPPRALIPAERALLLRHANQVGRGVA